MKALTKLIRPGVETGVSHIKRGVVLKIQVKFSEGSVVWMWFCVQQWKMKAGSVPAEARGC